MVSFAATVQSVSTGDKANTLTTIKKVVSGVMKKLPRLLTSFINNRCWYLACGYHSGRGFKGYRATQRDLNIAFVNELSVLFNRLE